MWEIAKSDIIARLYFDNPWWREGRAGKIIYEDKPRRKYFEAFSHAILETTVHRAIVLMGPRRVGKTVMVYHSIRMLLDVGTRPENILYVSLETPVYTGLPLERLLIYFQELFNHQRDSHLFLFLDEIQYLRDWEIHLKSLVDSFPSYRFVATGSAAAALRLKSTESGAGRFSDYILPPLTFAEYLLFVGKEAELIEANFDGFDNWSYSLPIQQLPIQQLPIHPYMPRDINALNQEFIHYINFGGYPEAVFSEAIRQNPGQYIKSDIIDKVLLRDLPSLYGISDIQELNRLFTTLAYNSGNEVSLEGLSRTSGVAKNTLKRYLEYLEAAFLIRRVERIDQNARRFKRAMYFKVYLTNPSMRTALFGEVGAEQPIMGAMTETAIFSQWQHSQRVELYYARWKTGEIDIVHLDQAHQSPAWIVEVKWSDRPYTLPAELDNCIEFVKNNPSVSQPILVTSKTIREHNFLYKKVRFQFEPASLYAYALGALRSQHNECPG